MSVSASQPPHIDRIVDIIRRDLMLGPDVVIEADTALLGGEFDLDSLDALLLMQSLEREFGFKLPTESFGPDVFKDVATLARFVTDNVSAGR